MKIFMTGATGFIGQPLTERLLKRGYHVIALVRNPESGAAKSLKNAGATIYEGDITRPESMRAAMEGVEIVYHNAAWYELGISTSAEQTMLATNVQGTKNTLGLAYELGVSRIIYTSTIGAFGPTCDKIGDENFERLLPPVTFYEYTKTEAHAFASQLQDSGAPLLIACPSTVVGPDDHSPWGYFARLYVRHLMTPVGWGKNTVFTPVHVEDVAEGLALMAEKGQPGKTYILAGEAITMKEIFDIWAGAPGGSRVYLWLPKSIAMLIGAIAGPLLRLVGQPAFLSREVVRVGCENWHFRADAAVKELGAQFRNPNQMWQQTLEAERTKILRHKRKVGRI